MKNKIISIPLILLFWSCNDTKEKVDIAKFDRKAMLQNYATNLIKPAFQDLKSQTDQLEIVAKKFVSNPNLTDLVALQTAWMNAYIAFQYTNSYNFGLAGEQGLSKTLSQEIATFPVTVSKIDNIIALGNANFNDFNRDARGFLAIEYLIFNIANNNNTIIDNFTINTNFSNRKSYLSNVIANIKTRIDAVHLAWNGSYSSEFVSNDGSQAGSSASLLYNDFVISFEALKNYKLGIPLGKRAGQTQTEAKNVEAYYSSNSLLMLKTNLKSMENIWYGKSKSDMDGIGFKEYLESVEGGKELIKSTETQLQVINSALAAIPTDISMVNQIQNSPALLEKLHVEIQKNTRFFKSDMSSKLGIAITFTSGDGD